MRKSFKNQLTLLLTSTLILLVTSAQPSLAKIGKGPMLLRLSTDKAAMVWDSDQPGSGKVYYSAKGRPAECVMMVTRRHAKRPLMVKYFLISTYGMNIHRRRPCRTRRCG